MYISNKARFISFEGIDGCGKSTQAKTLFNSLNDISIKSIFVREPGGTSIAEEIRSVLLKNRNSKMSNRTEALLMTASRAQLCEEVIIPNLKYNNWVIADRFSDSTLAYQGGGRGLEDNWLVTLNDFATFNNYPDITFYIDVDPEVGQQRRGESKPDRIEKAGLKLQRKIREKFIKICKIYPDRVFKVDGNKSVNELNSIIWKEIIKRRYIEEL